MKFDAVSSAEEENVDINVIPLIDVLLVLLIFFIMSTTFTETQGISIKLPSAVSATNDQAVKDLRVTITKDGTLMLGDKSIAFETLEDELRRSAATGTLVVRADRETQHGLVVRVMDMARKAGIQRLAVATAQE